MPQPGAPDIEDILSRAESLRARRGDPEVCSPHVLAVAVACGDVDVQAALRRAGLDAELTAGLLLDTLETEPTAIETDETPAQVRAKVQRALAAVEPMAVPVLALALRAVAPTAANRLERAGYAGGAERLRSLSRDLLRVGNQASPETQTERTPAAANAASDFASSSPPESSPGNEPRREVAELDFGHDLTAAARRGELHPVYGRTAELLQMIGTLTGRGIRNPVILGEPGVGKTALVEGLAIEISRGSVPPALRNARILAVEVGALVAGTNYRGTFEARIQKILDAAERDPNLIVFVDELHMLIGAGASDSRDPVDAANMLKPALADGRLRLIGATTHDEYRRFIEPSAALARRFAPISLGEPSVEATRSILNGLREHLQNFHDVTLELDAIDAAVALSVRYVTDRRLPDKAIRLLDRACSQRRLRAFYGFDDLRDLSPAEQQALLESCAERSEPLRADVCVAATDVELAASELTGVPVGRLREDETEELLHLEDRLRERVLGQDEAVRKIAAAIRVSRAGLADARGPIGAYLLVGPSGTGKTELAKAVAATVFKDEGSLVRVDMSECHDRSFINRLIGSPAGYVGSERGGVLTEAIRQRPHTVVLLDEIEKADRAIHMLLLGLMDEGTITDGMGRRIDCRNTIIMMTSNVGSSEIAARRPVGFGSSAHDVTQAEIDTTTRRALARTFPAEFMNRVDSVLVFAPLQHETVVAIARKMLSDLPIRVRATEAALEHLACEGYEPTMGARPLRRCIQSQIVAPLADKALRGFLKRDASVLVDLVNGALSVSEDANAPADRGREAAEGRNR